MWNIIRDFDRTIALGDTTTDLLTRFAAQSWNDVDQRHQAGLIGAAASLQMQIGLVRARREELDAAIDAMAVDSHFSSFAACAIAEGHRIVIVSDALAYVIGRVLKRLGVAGVDIVANQIRQTGDRTYELLPPHVLEGCVQSVCKCMAFAQRRPTLLIGGKQSELCAAVNAKMLLAKDSLLIAAREAGRDNVHPFRDFSDAARILASLPKPVVPAEPRSQRQKTASAQGR